MQWLKPPDVGWQDLAASRKKFDAMVTRLGIDRATGSEHNYMYVNPAEV